MDIFGRRRAARAAPAANQTSGASAPGRARHSVAVSSLGQHPSARHPFRNNDMGRQPYGRELPPRSISASYAPQVSSRSSIPRSATTYGRNRPLSELAGSPVKPKGRFSQAKDRLRQRLDFSWIKDWPSDKWMEFVEYMEMMDYEEMGYSFGFGLVGVHLFLRIISTIERARRNLMISRSLGGSIRASGAQMVGDRLSEARLLAKKQYPTGWLELVTVFSIALCLFSCYNTYILFTTRKPYRMQIREDPVNSPNAVLVQSPTAPDQTGQTWGQAFGSMLRRFSSLLIGWPGPAIDDMPKPSQIHQLDMWNPSDVRMKVFTLYPPPQAFFIHFATLNENCFHWVLIMSAIAFQTHMIVKCYSQLVKDKTIVQAEVMHEYNAQFVYPRTFPHTSEAGTMTSSAEFIRREDWLTY